MKNLDDALRVLSVLDELIAALHEVEACGGPLHIITDDGNLRDRDLVYCYRNVSLGEAVRTHTKVLCLAILHELALLTEPQRVVWWCSSGHHHSELDDVEVAQILLDAQDCLLMPENYRSVYDVAVVASTPDRRLVWGSMR